MSDYESPADVFSVVDGWPGRVRHLNVQVWAYDLGLGRSAPLCGTGSSTTFYKQPYSDREHRLPLCRRCKARLCEYIESVQREGEAL